MTRSKSFIGQKNEILRWGQTGKRKRDMYLFCPLEK